MATLPHGNLVEALHPPRSSYCSQLSRVMEVVARPRSFSEPTEVTPLALPHADNAQEVVVFEENDKDLYEFYAEDIVRVPHEKLPAVYPSEAVYPTEGEQEWVLRECSICWEEYRQCPRESLPCSHSFCRECLEGYISARLDLLELQFQCPDRSCSNVIPHEAIALQLTSLNGALLRAKRLNRQHNSVTCPACKQKVLRSKEELGPGLPGGAAVRYQCPNEECGVLFCLRCGGNYRGHEGVPCMDHSNVKSKRTLRERFWLTFKRVKACPNCLIYCMKNGGCDWVKCAQCAHEFCWVCPPIPPPLSRPSAGEPSYPSSHLWQKCLFPHSHGHHIHRWGITDADLQRRARRIKAAKALAVAGAVIAAPPVIVVGGVAAILAGIIAIPVGAVVLPAVGARRCYQRRAKRVRYVPIPY